MIEALQYDFMRNALAAGVLATTLRFQRYDPR